VHDVTFLNFALPCLDIYGYIRSVERDGKDLRQTEMDLRSEVLFI